jgi:hypothetical protein
MLDLRLEFWVKRLFSGKSPFYELSILLCIVKISLGEFDALLEWFTRYPKSCSDGNLMLMSVYSLTPSDTERK